MLMQGVRCMNPVSRLLSLWKRKDDNDSKISLMFYTCLCLIITVDVIFGYFFYYESIIMFIINTMCLFFNLFIYYLFEKNKKVLGLYLLLSELLIFLIFATITMGWSYGFQQYIYGMLCIFFLPFYVSENRRYTRIHIAVVGFIFISTYFILDYICNFTSLAPGIEKPIFSVVKIHALNSFVSIAAVSAFCIISSMINSDVTKKLRRKADFDELTSLYNRYGLSELLDEAREKNKYFYIAISDIDYFKKINDTYGHNAGDEVLRKIANKLLNLSKHSIYVGRWGGEEFLIIGDSSLGHQEFKNYLETYRKSLENKPLSIEGRKIKVTVSIGITKFDCKLSNEDNIRNADVNLYKAKETGRNKIIG